ncbi:MAG: Transglycosylase-like domain [Actinomycetota bacterium]|jgi:hypothetical protein
MMKKQIQIVLLALFMLIGSQSATSAVSATDPTSRLTKVQRSSVSFEVWISSKTAARVIKKESKGNCKAIGAKGKYRGKWQFNSDFWKTYGGLEFAPLADQATCEQQDQVAYRGWLARGWQPWGLR